MTLTDRFLNNMAKAINNESFDVISHLAVTSTVDFEATTDALNIGTELGTREVTGNTRSGDTVTLSAIRSGTDVVDTINGDTLTGLGYFEGLTGDTCNTVIALPSLNQTTGFDVEFNLEITPKRS